MAHRRIPPVFKENARRLGGQVGWPSPTNVSQFSEPNDGKSLDAAKRFSTQAQTMCYFSVSVFKVPVKTAEMRAAGGGGYPNDHWESEHVCPGTDFTEDCMQFTTPV